jgi:ribosomal protein S30
MGKHGGIAKAGKVRKQTPKAAKMDRDYKFKVGRSKMRTKYNKRFFYMKQTKAKGFNTQKV